MKARSVNAWRNGVPQILIVSPPCIGEGLYLRPEGEAMGRGCPEKSRGLAEHFRKAAENNGCFFWDAEGCAEFNQSDFMHLNKKGHAQMAEALSILIPEMLR